MKARSLTLFCRPLDWQILLGEIGPASKALRRRCQALILQGRHQEAEKDAKELVRRIGMRPGENGGGTMEQRLGGVPGEEARRLLKVCGEGLKTELKEEKEMVKRMVNGMGSGLGKGGATPRGVVEVSKGSCGKEGGGRDDEGANVITRMEAFVPEQGEDGEKPPVVMLERAGETGQGKAMRAKQEDLKRERERAGIEQGREREERERAERERALAAGGKAPPRHVPCHVSSSGTVEGTQWDRTSRVEASSVRGYDDVVGIAKEADGMWADMHHTLRQACGALKVGERGVVGGGMVGFVEAMMEIKEGLQANMKQADEMVAELKGRRGQAGKGGLSAGVRALRYKADKCMDLVAKVDMLLDPHADADQVRMATIPPPTMKRLARGAGPNQWRLKTLRRMCLCLFFSAFLCIQIMRAMTIRLVVLRLDSDLGTSARGHVKAQRGARDLAQLEGRRSRAEASSARPGRRRQKGCG